nr:hypothetical protein [Tanacetum cinerariifolium]
MKYDILQMSTSISFFSHGDLLEQLSTSVLEKLQHRQFQPSIPRRNIINWHYVRDDVLFSIIKVVSRHQTTQQYGAKLPIELTTDDIRNSKAYKEYYACATGEAAPKPKASARNKKGGSVSSTPPPTRIATSTQQLQLWLLQGYLLLLKQRGSSTDEGTGSRPGVPDVPSDDSEEELSWNSSDDEDVDEQTKGREESEGDKTNESDDGNDDDNDETVKDVFKRDENDDENDEEEEIAKIDEPEDTESDEGNDEATESDRENKDEETREQEEESFDLIPRTPEDNEDDDNDEEDQGLKLSEEERMQDEEEVDELYRDVNINQGRGLQVSQNIVGNVITQSHKREEWRIEARKCKERLKGKSSSVSSFVTSMLNPISDAGVESIFPTASSLIVSLQTLTPIMTPFTIATITTSSDAPIPPTTIPSIILENLPTFDSVDERLKSLETTFSEYRQTNPFVDAVSAIPENDEFLRNIDENMKKIIKEQVKSQVQAQVEAEVLTRSSHSSRTSYAIAADLSEMELKKILIEKIEGTNEDERMMIKKDHQLDQTGDQGSKRRREGGEHASASTPSETATGSAGRSTTGSQSRQLSASESAFAEEPPRRPPTPDRDWNKTLPAAQGDAQSWISELARQTDARSSFNELLDTPIDFSNFIMNRLGVATLTPELLTGPTYALMRGSYNSLTELEYHLEEV